jgi:hypothetical protein
LSPDFDAFVPFFLIFDPASASQRPRASNPPPRHDYTCTEEAMRGPSMLRRVGTTMARGGCRRKTTTGPGEGGRDTPSGVINNDRARLAHPWWQDRGAPSSSLMGAKNWPWLCGRRAPPSNRVRATRGSSGRAHSPGQKSEGKRLFSTRALSRDFSRCIPRRSGATSSH